MLGGLHVQQVHGRQGEGGQRLIEGEVAGQVDGQAQARTPVRSGPGARDVLEDPGGAQRLIDFDGAPHMPAPLGLAVVDAGEQLGHGGHRAAVALHEIQDHGRADSELAGEGLRGGVAQPLECPVRPVDTAFGGLLAHDPAALALIIARPGQGLGILDDVLGGLDDDVAARVETGPPGPAGDLMELAGGEMALLGAVELDQAGEHH